MIPTSIQPVIRRAIIDLIDEIGGEQSHYALTILLNGIGHRVARCDVEQELIFLEDAGLVSLEKIAPFTIAQITPDGVDVSAGTLQLAGVYRHKTAQ